MSQVADEQTALYRGSFATDAGYPARFVADSTRYRLRYSASIRVLPIVALACGVFIGATSDGPLSTRLLWGFGTFLGLAMLYLAQFAVGYAAHLRRTRMMIPVGSVYQVTVFPDALAVHDWKISSQNRYSLWKSVVVMKHHLVFQRADSGIFTPLARELFTPEVETWLINRVQTARTGN